MCIYTCEERDLHPVYTILQLPEVVRCNSNEMEANGSACAVATWDTGSSVNDCGDCGCSKPLRELPSS